MARILKNKPLIALALLGVLFFGLCIGCGVVIFTSPAPHLEEDTAPSWSPDGQYLAFECYVEGPAAEIAESNVRHYTQEAADICKTDAGGHNRIRLTGEQGQDRYPRWSPDGMHIAYVRQDGIYIVNSDGSNRGQVLQYNNAIEEIGKVVWLPQGAQFLFSARLEDSERDVYLLDVNTGALTNLTMDNATHDFTPIPILDGTKVIFLASASSWYAPSQLKIVNIDGSDEEVINIQEIYYTSISASNSGQIAFSTHDLAQDYLDHLYVMSLDKKMPIDITSVSHRWLLPSWSPDGRFLVYQDRSHKLLELETGQVKELPIDGFIEETPDWSPDNQQIAITIPQPHDFYSEKHIFIIDILDGPVRQLTSQE